MDRHLPGLVEGARASGDPGLLWASLFNQQGRALLAGDLDATEAPAGEAFAVGTAGGMPDAGFAYAVALAAVRTLQDRTGEVVEIYEGAVAQAPGLAFLRSHLARLYCLLGRRDEARALFAPDAADGVRSFEYDWTWLYGITSHAEVCARLGDAGAAAVCTDSSRRGTTRSCSSSSTTSARSRCTSVCWPRRWSGSPTPGHISARRRDPRAAAGARVGRPNAPRDRPAASVPPRPRRCGPCLGRARRGCHHRDVPWVRRLRP